MNANFDSNRRGGVYRWYAEQSAVRARKSVGFQSIRAASDVAVVSRVRRQLNIGSRLKRFA